MTKGTKNDASLSRLLLACLVILFGVAQTADADTVTTYSYTGDPFTSFNGSYACPPQCAITGSFTVAGPLPANLSGGAGALQFDFNVVPLSYTVTDGNVTATNANSCYDFFSIGTDSSGNISSWVIRIFTPATNAPCGGGGIYTGVQLLTHAGVIDITIEAPAAVNFASSLPNTGTWSTQVTLSVSLSGSGSGTVQSTPPGINCPADCSGTYEGGTLVALVATPALGSVFAGWSGDSGCSTGVVDLDADTSCIATFNADTIPPAITISAVPTTLWPPNGKMLPVTVSGTITDTASSVNAGSATYAVADEYGTVQPSGPVTLGSNGSYVFTVSLQASRSGNDKDGRHYTITVSVQDNAGNNGSAVTVVTVPHDQGK